MRFVYKILHECIMPNELENVLNEMGKNGWQLVKLFRGRLMQEWGYEYQLIFVKQIND